MNSPQEFLESGHFHYLILIQYLIASCYLILIHYLLNSGEQRVLGMLLHCLVNDGGTHKPNGWASQNRRLSGIAGNKKLQDSIPRR